MTPREIASMWVIGIAAIFVIVWDYRTQLARVANIQPLPTSDQLVPALKPGNLGTNDPIPMPGDRQGWLATYGNVIDGAAQSGGPDSVFTSIFARLRG